MDLGQSPAGSDLQCECTTLSLHLYVLPPYPQTCVCLSQASANMCRVKTFKHLCTDVIVKDVTCESELLYMSKLEAIFDSTYQTSSAAMASRKIALRCFVSKGEQANLYMHACGALQQRCICSTCQRSDPVDMHP